MGITTKYLYNHNRILDTELGIAKSNVRSYENSISGLYAENSVLRLNISDLSHSNDILMQSIDSTRKALKIKDNALKMASRIETIINDTTIIELPASTNCDFEIVIQKHPFSKYEISRKDNTFVHIPTILNVQDLIVHDTKVWRNPGKNFFQRLFSLDFKKDRVLNYTILNTNPDMEITNSRVIKINDK